MDPRSTLGTNARISPGRLYVDLTRLTATVTEPLLSIRLISTLVILILYPSCHSLLERDSKSLRKPSQIKVRCQSVDEISNSTFKPMAVYLKCALCLRPTSASLQFYYPLPVLSQKPINKAWFLFSMKIFKTLFRRDSSSGTFRNKRE